MSIKIGSLFKEPFIQFLILGGLLFVFVSYIQQQRDKQSREITVNNEQVKLMIINYRAQMGDLPTGQQLNAMIDSYINEEISYREAKKIGLDKDDEIIRRRLSQKFDFLQTDMVDVKQPTEEDLLQFYNSHQQLFQKEVTVSFSHIYFSPDNSTDSLTKQRALTVLQQLKNSSLQHAFEKGDRFSLQYDYTDQAKVDVQQNFGDKPIVDTLFKGPLNKWLGPVQSGYGWHLIFISKRGSADEMPFASAKDDVKAQYLDSAKAAQNKMALDKISEKYIINRAYLDSK